MLIIHEESTKEIIAVKESLYVTKHTWILRKLFCLKFLGLYTTSILKVLTQTNRQDGYKIDRF